MGLNTAQTESWSSSLVALSAMTLSGLLVQVIINAYYGRNNPPPLPPRDPDKDEVKAKPNMLPLFIVIGILCINLWIAGFVAWCVFMTKVSGRARNAGLVLAFAASNVGVGWRLSDSQRRWSAGDVVMCLGIVGWGFHGGLWVSTLAVGFF